GQGLLQDARTPGRLPEGARDLQPRARIARPDRGLREERIGRPLPQPQPACRGRPVKRGTRLRSALDARVSPCAARTAVSAICRARIAPNRCTVTYRRYPRPAGL